MLNGGIRYSLTEKNIPFPVEGIFADDGDNLQTSIGLSLIQTFLENNQLVFSPSIGISNTHYLRNLHDGRNDLVFFCRDKWTLADYRFLCPAIIFELFHSVHQFYRRRPAGSSSSFMRWIPVPQSI